MMRFVLPVLSLVTLALALFQTLWTVKRYDTVSTGDQVLMLAYAPYVLVTMLIVQVSLVFWTARKQKAVILATVKKELGADAVEELASNDWMLDALSGGVVAVNNQFRIIYINKSAEKLIAKDKNSVLGLSLQTVMQIEDLQGNSILNDLLKKPTDRNNQSNHLGQVKLMLPNSDDRFVELTVASIKDDKESNVLIFRDVTADRKIINRLYQQASRDPLTNLMNRASFEQYLAHVITDTAGVVRTHLLASIDLDNFKPVNDTCGHQAGDELLKQIAQIFVRTIRRSDKVARIGGDEFAIFLEGCGIDKGRALMESILMELRNFRFTWEGKVFNVGASIGLIEFSPSQKLHIKQLFVASDKACYTAKSLGRNQVVVHVNDILPDVEVSNQQVQDWGKLLRDAIKEDRFILFAQPIVPLNIVDAKKCHQYEVLLRLPFRQTLLSPGSFMSVANRLDLMLGIDRWIIHKSIEILAESRQTVENRGIDNRLMINLSAQSVQDSDLAMYVENQIRQMGVNPSMICFEISESVAISHFMHTKRLMTALHDIGCHLVLDDFGSGFSSFSYLRELPLTYLKIDGNFVHNLVTNPVDAAMVKAVHEVGRVMNLLTIAELVEDAETLELLRKIGVNFAQGYHCGRPIPLNHLGEHLQEQVVTTIGA